MSTTQPVGFTMRSRWNERVSCVGAAGQRIALSGVHQTDTGRQFTIRAAPTRDPRLDAEEMEVALREISSDFPDL